MRRRIIFSILLLLASAPTIVRAQFNQFEEDRIHLLAGYYLDHPMWCLEIHDGHLFIGDGDLLFAMKVNSPTELEQKGYVYYTNVQYAGLWSLIFHEGYLYGVSAEGNDDRIVVFEISDPSNLRFVASRYGSFLQPNLITHKGEVFISSHSFVYRIKLDENKVPFVVDSVFALYPGINAAGPIPAFRDSTIFFINDLTVVKAHYLHLSEYSHVLDFDLQFNCLLIRGDYMFVGDVQRVIVYKLNAANEALYITEISHPRMLTIDKLYLSGDHLVTLSADAGIFIINISDPENPYYEGSATGGGSGTINDLRINDGYIYALSGKLTNNLLVFGTDDILTTAPPPPAPTSLSLSLAPAYPNPILSGSATTVEFALPASGQVTLTLCNTLGQELRRIEKRMEPGTHSERISTSGLNPGVYYYTLTAEGTRNTEMLVVR